MKPKEPTTKPLPRADLAPTGPAPDPGDDTKERCPICSGNGYLPPEEKILADVVLRRMQEEQ